MAYIDQALSGPNEVAFLPAYYAILNLLKVYILSSGKYQLLPANRWHGASYDGSQRTRQSLLTEEILLRSGGTVPLFYEVITGARVRDRTLVKLRDVYPYIANVGLEWTMATGSRPLSMVGLASKVELVRKKKRARFEVVIFSDHPSDLSKRRIPALHDVNRVPKQSMIYRSSRAYASGTPDEVVIRGHIRSFLLYAPTEELAITPNCSPQLMLPEELPIVLAFFHLSSIVRYQPESFARLRDSKYWPVLSAMRSQGLFRFLTLFWSFVQQQTVTISGL